MKNILLVLFLMLSLQSFSQSDTVETVSMLTFYKVESNPMIFYKVNSGYNEKELIEEMVKFLKFRYEAILKEEEISIKKL